MIQDAYGLYISTQSDDAAAAWRAAFAYSLEHRLSAAGREVTAKP